MSWKLKLMKLNWKFKLMIGLGVGLAMIALLKFPASQAQTDSKTAVQETQAPVTRGKITEYPNGVKHVEPNGFAITGPVREMQPDPGSVNSRIEREERRKQTLRDKGMSVEEIEEYEINRQNAKRIKKLVPGAGADAGNSKFQDPLVNNRAGGNSPQVMPTPSLTFDGARQVDNQAVGIGMVLPPDVNGDVGPNDYVSSVNLVLKFFNKSGGVTAGPIATSALFAALPAGDPCRVNNDGDPIVLYDTLADRWHISQFGLPGGTANNFQCVALSVTGDPTGAYYIWSYEYPGPAGTINDYPKVGVWPDAYHMTFNQFNPGFTGAGFLSQDRPRALTGDPNARVVYFNVNSVDPSAGGLLPGDIDGYLAPPVGLAQVIGEYRSNETGDPIDGLRNYIWVPNFENPAMTQTPTILPDVPLAAFDGRNPNGRLDIEQMGGANLDSIADRSMHRFAYRNFGTQAAPVNGYIGNFTVNVSGAPAGPALTAATYQAGIRWFELRRTGNVFSVFDQGTHNLTPGNGATGLNNWMSSIAQDVSGNIGLGFSQSGTTQRADIKIAGRTGGLTAAGTLNEGEALFHAATGSQTSTSGRWGDYSAMNVDPTDGCTFWYTQEYYAVTSSANWSTRVGKFIYPSCVPAPTATITGTITSCATGLPINQASVNATGGFNRQTNASGTFSIIVAPGTYTVSASQFPGFTAGSTQTVTVGAGGTATANICLTGVPILNATTATIVSESCQPANGVVDPGETVTVAFGVQNVGGANTVNDIGTLQNTGGVTGASGPQNYGVITAGGPPVVRNFTFTADPNLFCGTNITATIAHVDGATNFGNLTYTLPTGTTGAPSTTSYTGPPVAIPDLSSVNVVLPVSGFTGAISDLNFRLDSLPGCNNTVGNPNASVTHTFVGDLQFRLTSPAGTSVDLIINRGGAGVNFCTILLDDDGGFPAASAIPTTGGVSGNFRPESPLSAFDGQNPNGNWTLRVLDNGPADIGTLNRFSLIITPRVCSTNCGGPLPTPTPVATPTPTPTPTPVATPTPTPTPTPGGTPTPTPTPGGTCTPSATVTEGDLFPGGIVSFGVTSGPGSVTVDHVNAGTGLQSLTLVGVPVNAVVNIPPFAPGTFNPVTVTFTTPNPGQAVDFTLRAASTFHAAFIRVRCMQTCTPSTTVTEGNLFPGGVVSFGVAGGPGTVTVDHVNAGTGLQSLTVVGVPINAIVTIPAFMPGTINPVVVTFTVINPALPVDFTLRAASQFHAANIRAQCGTVTPTPTPTPVGTPTPTPTPVASPTPTPGMCPTFTNPTPIVIPNVGPASPYPSTINASGLGGTVTKVTVTLNNFNHTFPDDVDVLLVGPGGQSVILMSDAGGALDVTNVNLTFDDAAAAMLPDSTQIVSGTYRPTNFGVGDTFVAPAPAGPYGTMLSVFNGTAPNGAYSLYVVDDLGGDIGNFNGGWTLNVTTTSCGGTTPTPTPVASPTPTPVASPTPTPGGTPTPTPTPGACPTTITQSSSQTITPANSVACFNAAANITRDNSFWRAFSLAAFGIGAGQSYTVTSVSFGIEVAATNPAGGTQPITVNLYANNGAAFPGGTRTLIGTATVQVADQTGTILSVPIAAVAPAGTSQLVMEVRAPDCMAAGCRFFPGSNTAAETGPSYVSSTACAIATPTTYTALGFPNIRLVFNVMGSCAGNAPITLKSNSSDVSALNPVVSSWFTDAATKVDPLKNFGLEKSGTSGDALMTYQPK